MTERRDPRSKLLRRALGEAPVPVDACHRITEQALRRLASADAGARDTDTSLEAPAKWQRFGRARTLVFAAGGIAAMVVVVLMLASRLLTALDDQSAGHVVEAPPPSPSHLATTRAKAIWQSEDAEMPVRVGPHRVVLSPRSRLRLQRRRQANVELALEAGRAHFSVRKLAPGSSFRVRTPQLQVEVVGTRFSVVTTGTCTRVAVQSGRVRVTAAGEPLLIGPGEEDTRCSDDGRPLLEGRSEHEQLFTRALALLERGSDDHAARLLWRCVRAERDEAQPSLVAREALFHLALLEKRRGRHKQARQLARRYLSEFGSGPQACRLRATIFGSACAGD